MIKIPYNYKLIERNEKIHGMNDGTHCIICNKPVNVDKHKYWVRLVNGGCYIGTPEEGQAEPAADLGYYPIGRDCLNRHPEIEQYVDKRVHGVSVKLWPV